VTECGGDVLSPEAMQPMDEADAGSAVDSFVACVQGAMARWGCTVGYDSAAALAGAAFSPMLGHRGVCAGCWREFASDARIEFLGHALGFTFERGPAPFGVHPASGDFARKAERALRAGAVAVFGPAPRWSLAPLGEGYLIDWALERCSVAAQCSRDNQPRLYVLRRARPCLTGCEAVREALSFGAATAAGVAGNTGAARAPMLYDIWVEQVQRGAFCPSHSDHGWSCADRAARRAGRAELSAARFLDAAGDVVPELRWKGDVADSVRAYEEIAAMLSHLAHAGADTQDRSMHVERMRRAGELHGAAARHLNRVAQLVRGIR